MYVCMYVRMYAHMYLDTRGSKVSEGPSILAFSRGEGGGRATMTEDGGVDGVGYLLAVRTYYRTYVHSGQTAGPCRLPLWALDPACACTASGQHRETCPHARLRVAALYACR